jgi:hypothetical protein
VSGRSTSLAEERDHLAERVSSGALGRLDVLELLDDVETFALGVLGEELSLRRDRESLFLFLGGDADVGDCGTSGGRLRGRLLTGTALHGAAPGAERCQCRQ